MEITKDKNKETEYKTIYSWNEDAHAIYQERTNELQEEENVEDSVEKR